MNMQYLKDKEYGRIQDMILVRLSAMEGVIQDLQNVGADKKQQSDQATNTEHYTPISSTPPPLPPPLPPLPRYGSYPCYIPQTPFWYGHESSTAYSGFHSMHYSPTGSYYPNPPVLPNHQNIAARMEVPASTASQPPRYQPIKYKQKVEKMSSSQINKDKLADPHKIIEKFKNHKSVSRASTLAQKLAKEAFLANVCFKPALSWGSDSIQRYQYRSCKS